MLRSLGFWTFSFPYIWKRIHCFRYWICSASVWERIHFLISCKMLYIHTGCPRRNVPDFGRMFLMIKCTDITQNTYIQSWTVTEIMAREKCGLLVVPCTVPVSRVVTRTLRMSLLQSYSRVKHILTSLSTDVTVTVNCNSILLDIHVPCKVFWIPKGNYDISASLCSLIEWLYVTYTLLRC